MVQKTVLLPTDQVIRDNKNMKLGNIIYTPVMAQLAEEWFESLEDQSVKAMVHILMLEHAKDVPNPLPQTLKSNL